MPIFCSMCIHDKPGCLVCKADVLRAHNDEGMRSPKVCEHYDDIREHCDFKGGVGGPGEEGGVHGL